MEEEKQQWNSRPLNKLLVKLESESEQKFNQVVYIHIILCNKWNYKSVLINNRIARALEHVLQVNNYKKEIDLTELTNILDENLEEHLILHSLRSSYILRFKQGVYYKFYQALVGQRFFIYEETFIFFTPDPYFEFPPLINRRYQKQFQNDYDQILKKYDLEQIENEIHDLEQDKIVTQKEDSPLKLRHMKSKSRYAAPSSKKLKQFHSVTMIKNISNVEPKKEIKTQTNKKYQTSLEQIWGPDHKNLSKMVAKSCLLGFQVRAERFLKKNIDIYQDEVEFIKEQEAQEKEQRKQHRKELKKIAHINNQ